VTATTASSPVVVDSSGWIEYWGNGPKSPLYDPYFAREDCVFLPTIIIYEVYKKLSITRGAALADRFLSYAFRTKLVPLDETLAIAAAEVSIKHRLSMADAIIYTTALACSADLVTSDQAFSGLPGVTLL
jgi:predicted nucleic acid-binding protein